MPFCSGSVRSGRWTDFALLMVLVATCASALFCGDDNCFDLLGVARNATKSDIRRAYRRISQEKHPDKRPGVEGAVEEFRKIGTAYETLTDDAKRAKYEDFLDNPGKYWQYLMENAKDVYAPKSNVYVVITGIVGLATLLHWLHMNHSYKQTIARMKESLEFKREVTRLMKVKKGRTKEEAEAMINMDVVGLEEPDWRDLVIFKFMSLPGRLAKFAMWKVHWVVDYKIRKLEYSDEDKAYLIQQNMNIDETSWNALGESEKEGFFKEELWDFENCEEFLRLKRIQLNRLGKGKKKKRHTPVPYSEVEEVTMSE